MLRIKSYGTTEYTIYVPVCHDRVCFLGDGHVMRLCVRRNNTTRTEPNRTEPNQAVLPVREDVVVNVKVGRPVISVDRLLYEHAPARVRAFVRSCVSVHFRVAYTRVFEYMFMHTHGCTTAHVTAHTKLWYILQHNNNLHTQLACASEWNGMVRTATCEL
jgi:hypothetical protein